jgi:predicted ABC-type ATPase
MSAKLIILRGNAGSGKSTISAELKQKLNGEVLYLEQDLFRLNIIKVENDENFSVRRNTQTIGAILSLLNWGKDNFDYIILEGIYSVPNYIAMFDQIKLMFNQFYAYYFDLTFEETAKRHLTREKSKIFGVDTMREWFKEKNYLPQIEETKITKDQSKEEIVNMILKDIGII